VLLECCQSANGLKVEEEEKEKVKDYPILEKYQDKFVVLHEGFM
jgi:hypothetical protein